ncbi:hypothetical protein Bca4012_088525 [Brassica carinata]
MHVAACARDSVSSARCWFLQLSSDGCIVILSIGDESIIIVFLHDVSACCYNTKFSISFGNTTIWEVIEFRAIYYLTVEEMKRYGAKRGGHTCASLSYDSESSVELRAPRPFHVKVVTLEPTCF